MMPQDWTPAQLGVAMRSALYDLDHPLAQPWLASGIHIRLDPPGPAPLKGHPPGSVEAADFLCETSSCVQPGEILDEKAGDDPGQFYHLGLGDIMAMSDPCVQPPEIPEQKGKALYCGSALVGWTGELSECVVGQVCEGCRWEIVSGEAVTFSRELGLLYHDRCVPFISMAKAWEPAETAEVRRVAGHVFEGVGSSRRCVRLNSDGKTCGRYWDEISGVNRLAVGDAKAHVVPTTDAEVSQVLEEEMRLARIEATMFSGTQLGR